MGIFTRIVERMDRQSNLMGAMMKRLEVDPVTLATESEGARIQSAARTCLMCRDSEECARWLEGNGDTPPDFCANSALFASYHK